MTLSLLSRYKQPGSASKVFSQNSGLPFSDSFNKNAPPPPTRARVSWLLCFFAQPLLHFHREREGRSFENLGFPSPSRHGHRRRRREGPLAASVAGCGVVAEHRVLPRARAHRRVAQAADAAVTGLLLVKAAGDTSLCLFLAAIWLLAASVAAVNLGRVFCGDYDCALVVAGVRVLCLSALAIGPFSAPAILVFVHRVELLDSDNGDEEGRGPKGLAEAVEEVLGNRSVMLGMVAGLHFLVLVIVRDLLKGFSPSKGSPIEELGSQVNAMGTLGKDAFWCLVIIPSVALMVWRVTRPGWRCHGAIEKTP